MILSTLQNNYPYMKVELPGREETFILQTANPQWVIQIIPFESKEQYQLFIDKQVKDTYSINHEMLVAAMAVSPIQPIHVTLDNMKEQNNIQQKAEEEALVWWIKNGK